MRAAQVDRGPDARVPTNPGMYARAMRYGLGPGDTDTPQGLTVPRWFREVRAALVAAELSGTSVETRLVAKLWEGPQELRAAVVTVILMHHSDTRARVPSGRALQAVLQLLGGLPEEQP